MKKFRVCFFQGRSTYREKVVEARSKASAKALVERELKKEGREYKFATNPVIELRKPEK